MFVMQKKYDSQLIDLFCQIDDKITMSEIMSNLLSPRERKALAIRLQVFKKLLSGEKQRDIVRDLEVGIATVTRGSRELKYGKPGIKKVLKK